MENYDGSVVVILSDHGNGCTILKRINELIRDIKRSPFSGIGKPEPLKHQLTGFWSRRIVHCHRLVYCIENETILIAQCRDHY